MEQEEKTIEWKGYSFMDHNETRIYSINLSEEKANRLWEKFKQCKNQCDFYFEFVNPLKLLKEKKGDHK